MHRIPIEQLKSVPYLNTSRFAGRTANVIPFWDGVKWRMWLPAPKGLVEVKPIEAIQTDYVAKSAAKETDLYIPFVELMWQRASWSDICPLTAALCEDFHEMGTSVAKLKLFFDSRITLGYSAARFATTEIEYLVMVARSVFDLLQEMIARIWNNHVRLNDPDAERRRSGKQLPKTFSKIVLRDKKELRPAEEIESTFGLPAPLAKAYAREAEFFSTLRDMRDDIVHGLKEPALVITTDRGFCVNPKVLPFSSFQGWRDDHRFNENCVSVLPWLADVIVRTIGACNSLMTRFSTIIVFPPEIAPDFHVFVRSPHTDALCHVLQITNGGSPWWGTQVPVGTTQTGNAAPQKSQ